MSFAHNTMSVPVILSPKPSPAPFLSVPGPRRLTRHVWWLTLVATWLLCSCASGRNVEVPNGEVTATEVVEPEPEPLVLAPETDPWPAPEAPPSCVIGTEGADGACVVSAEDRRAAMPASLQWDVLMSTCPDEEYGSFAETWVWQPNEAEREILALDLAGPATTFGLLADYEGTSIIIRIRDTETNSSVAVIKTTTSNTRINAEIYAYRLSEFLQFDGLVPPTSPVDLEGSTLRKMSELLSGLTYRDANKEANRQRLLTEVNRAIASGGAYYGALKPWLRGFMFHGGLGDRDRLANAAVMRFLRATGPQPDDDYVTLQQWTRLYSPRGTHRGRIRAHVLARDLSNYMLMDALMGQNDRFAGANLHFQSTTSQVTEAGVRNNDPIWEMGDVRLLALDNGAALRGRVGAGIRDLRGTIVAGTRVERFDRQVVERLRGLSRRAMGRYCETSPFEDEAAAIWAYLGVADAEAASAQHFLVEVLDYIDELEERYGDRIYFEPVLDGVDDGPSMVIEGDDEGLE